MANPLEAKSTADLISVSNTSLPSQSQTPGCHAAPKKSVGLFEGMSLIVGSMIGSGIFASARTVAKLSGSVGMLLITWVGTGMLAMCGALCYAELGTTFTVSGGDYSYLHAGFGPVVAFMNAWVTILILKPSSLSAITLTCGNYFIEPFYPSIVGCFPEALTKEHLAKLIAATAIGETLLRIPSWQFH